MKIENWKWVFIEPFGKNNTMINEKMMKELIGEELINDEFHVHLMGNLGDRYVITSYIKSIEDGVAITNSGSRYELGEKSKEQLLFDEATSLNNPVLNNWFLGRSEKGKFYISGYKYQDSEFQWICDEVVDQSLDRQSLELKENGETFVDWRSISLCANIEVMLSSSAGIFDGYMPNLSLSQEELAKVFPAINPSKLELESNLTDTLVMIPCKIEQLNTKHNELIKRR